MQECVARLEQEIEKHRKDFETWRNYGSDWQATTNSSDTSRDDGDQTRIESEKMLLQVCHSSTDITTRLADRDHADAADTG